MSTYPSSSSPPSPPSISSSISSVSSTSQVDQLNCVPIDSSSRFRERQNNLHADNLKLKQNGGNKSSILTRLYNNILERIKRRKQFLLTIGKNSSFIILIFLVYSFWKRVQQRRRISSSSTNDINNAIETSLSTLYDATSQNKNTKVLLSTAYCLFLENDQWKKVILPPKLYNSLFTELSTKGVQVSIMKPSLLSRISSPLLSSIPFLYLYCVYRMMKNLFHDPPSSSSSSKDTISHVTLSQVAGAQQAKLELADILSYLYNPEPYQMLGAKCPRGILLHGPPGNGKTLLAKAVAGEVSCPFYYCSATEFVEVLVGRGAARIRSLFKQARRDKIAVIFIDEIDAIGKHRASAISSCEEREQTLNQLLIEMDGFCSNADSSNVVVIAATNRIEVLDSALLRPGRFDRHIHVGYPTSKDREDILWLYAQKLAMEENVEGFLRKLAHDEELLFQFSGADLQNVVNEAALLSIRNKNSFVKKEYFSQAIRKVTEMKNIKKTEQENVFSHFLSYT